MKKVSKTAIIDQVIAKRKSYIHNHPDLIGTYEIVAAVGRAEAASPLAKLYKLHVYTKSEPRLYNGGDLSVPTLDDGRYFKRVSNGYYSLMGEKETTVATPAKPAKPAESAKNDDICTYYIDPKTDKLFTKFPVVYNADTASYDITIDPNKIYLTFVGHIVKFNEAGKAYITGTFETISKATGRQFINTEQCVPHRKPIINISTI